MEERVRKLTVRDLLECKGKRQLTEVLVTSTAEAAACEAAGIDMIVAGVRTRREARDIRAAAPNTFLISGIPYGKCASKKQAVKAAFKLLDDGADAVYAVMSLKFMQAMAAEGIPLVGHVGLIPSKRTWTGGYRAVGKTADEALRVYQDTLALQDAGVIAVEMEVVPHQVATEISKRVDLIVISMGSGAGCDAQYLFAMDLLGENRGHVPRHAKGYRDFSAEHERLQTERIAAFSEFSNDVTEGRFPAPENIVDSDSNELERFLKSSLVRK